MIQSSAEKKMRAKKETLQSRAKKSILWGHGKKVLSLSWNVNGDYLVSGSNDYTIRLWSAGRKFACERTLKAHKKPVEQVAFSPVDPNIMVSAGEDSQLYFWDTRKSKPFQVIETDGNNINVAWSPDGSHIAIGNKDDEVMIVSNKYRSVLSSLKYNHEVNQLRWDKTGKWLFMAAYQSRCGGCVDVMKCEYQASNNDLKAVSLHRRLIGHTSKCYSIDIDPRGKYLASGSDDAMVCIWDLDDYTCRKTISRLEWPVQTLSFSFDGSLLACGSEDSFVEVADVETGEQIWRQAKKGLTDAVAWHPQQPILAHASEAYAAGGRGEAPGSDRGAIHVVSFTK